MVGLIVGSFLNSFLWRYQEKVTYAGRSMCPCCKHQISWHDNVPVVSWFLLSGKCRYCKKSISVQYPLVEALTGLAFLMVGTFSQSAKNITHFFVIPATPSPVIPTGVEGSLSGFLGLARNDIVLLVILLFITAVMVMISVYDYKTKEMPNGFNLTFIIGCLFYALFASFISDAFLASLSLLLASSFVAFLFFYSFVFFSKETWMGGGDAKFAIGMGLLLGPAGTFLAIMIASIVGSVYGIGAIIAGRLSSRPHSLLSSRPKRRDLKKKKDISTAPNMTGRNLSHEIPFGPFLALGTFVVICFGAQIINFYVKIVLGL